MRAIKNNKLKQAHTIDSFINVVNSCNSKLAITKKGVGKVFFFSLRINIFVVFFTFSSLVSNFYHNHNNILLYIQIRRSFFLWVFFRLALLTRVKRICPCLFSWSTKCRPNPLAYNTVRGLILNRTVY